MEDSFLNPISQQKQTGLNTLHSSQQWHSTTKKTKLHTATNLWNCFHRLEAGQLATHHVAMAFWFNEYILKTYPHMFNINKYVIATSLPA